MSERGVSPGVQASSTRGLTTSLSTAQARPSRQTDDKHTKHRDNIVNAKLIPSTLPSYLPPLSDAINKDSFPRDFDYALVMAYLSKGIHAV
jgi:hypothetical protein